MFSKLTTGFKFFIILLVVGGLGAAYYMFGPKTSKNDTSTTTVKTEKSGGIFDKVTSSFGGGTEFTLGVNTWTGYAPIVWMNGGSLEPNKESRLYKDYGILLTIKIMDVFNDCRGAFKSGDLDIVYCTVDALPVEMGSNAGMAQMNARLFGQVDWSRGGDLIVVTKYIKTVADLKGKNVAVAEGTASHTFLIKTLESNGLQMTDITLIKVEDGIEAAKLFKAGQVDAAVVWTPDDGDCIKTIKGSKRLVSTKIASFVIADGLIATEEFINENQEGLTKLMTAWLTANGELNSDPAKRQEAAKAFSDCFNVDMFFAENGLKNVRLSTFGDNLNFFDLNSTYQGVTGADLYNKMSITYSNLKLTKNPLAWRSVSNTDIIESITMTDTGKDAAEEAITFKVATKEIETKEAISNKKVSISFETGSYTLDDDDKRIIDQEFVSIAKDFGMARVRIEGNTDDTGSASVNKSISQKRAQSVANYMVREHGFDANKFIVIGNGSEKAINDRVKGSNEFYRRTDFQLVSD